jgi:hypothetical protein
LNIIRISSSRRRETLVRRQRKRSRNTVSEEIDLLAKPKLAIKDRTVKEKALEKVRRE